MDLFGILIKLCIETVVHMLNAGLDIITYGVYTTTDLTFISSIQKYITPLEKYAAGIAYTFLATFVLISILKQLLQEDDISFASILIRVTMTAIAIGAIPILMDYIADRSNVIIVEMSSLIKLDKPNVDAIDFETMLKNILKNSSNIAFANMLFNFVIAQITIILIIVLYIQTLFYKTILIVMRIMAPIVALGVLSYNFEILTTFIKDVIGISVMRIIQSVLIRLSFALMFDILIDIFDIFSKANKDFLFEEYYVHLHNMLLSCVFVLTIVFMPSVLKKYTTTSGAGDALQGIVRTMGLIGMMGTGGKIASAFEGKPDNSGGSGSSSNSSSGGNGKGGKKKS